MCGLTLCKTILVRVKYVVKDSEVGGWVGGRQHRILFKIFESMKQPRRTRCLLTCVQEQLNAAEIFLRICIKKKVYLKLLKPTGYLTRQQL